MKKSLLALSLLGAFAGSACAQSTVTMYGVLDAGLNYESTAGTSTTGNLFSLQSGISAPSRIGFKGSEDINSSLKAIFDLEAGIQINNGTSTDTGTLFNRQSWLGLSGDFGSVMVGRQFTPMYNAVYAIDPFELGMAGNAGNLMHLGGANLVGNVVVGGNTLALENGGGSQSQNNSLRYVSHDWNGFSLEANYGMGGQAGNTNDGTESGATVNYNNGPVMLLASFDNVNAINNSNTFKTTLVGGSLNWTDYGVPLKTNFGYQTNKGSDLVNSANIDSTDLLLGLRIPVGPHEVLFSYIHSDNKIDGGKGDQYALGYTYALSKRTTFYSSVGKIINKNDDFTTGNASNAGYGVKVIDMGLRHAF